MLPNLRITVSDCLFASASFRVGTSRKSPLATIRSALASSETVEGDGSYVCELVPSGMRPLRTILVPPMFSTRLVIGDTVATTLIPEDASFFGSLEACEQPMVKINTSANKTNFFKSASFLPEM